MKSYYLIFIFALAFGKLTAQVPDSMKYRILSPEEFLKESASDSNSVIVDVRDPKDYRKARIAGAVNVDYPVYEEYFTNPDAVPVDKVLYLYCYAGFSSRKAAVDFYNHGYRNLFSLEGGFMKWKGKRMPVDKKRHKPQDTGR